MNLYLAKEFQISPVWFWFSWGPRPRWLLIRCNLPPGGLAHSDQVNLSFNALSPRGGSLSFLFLKETVSREILNFLLLNRSAHSLKILLPFYILHQYLQAEKIRGFWIVLGQNWSIEDYIICLRGSSAIHIDLDPFFPKPCAISWLKIFSWWRFFIVLRQILALIQIRLIWVSTLSVPEEGLYLFFSSKRQCQERF
jgi:hypothetical protein